MFTYINYTFGVINRGGSRIYSKGGGAHLKKLRRAEGGANMFGVFRVKNHEFTPKKIIFFPILGEGGRERRPPPGSTPDQHFNLNEMVTKLNLHLSFKLIDERIHAKISET